VTCKPREARFAYLVYTTQFPKSADLGMVLAVPVGWRWLALPGHAEVAQGPGVYVHPSLVCPPSPGNVLRDFPDLVKSL